MVKRHSHRILGLVKVATRASGRTATVTACEPAGSLLDGEDRAHRADRAMGHPLARPGRKRAKRMHKQSPCHSIHIFRFIV